MELRVILAPLLYAKLASSRPTGDELETVFDSGAGRDREQASPRGVTSRSAWCTETLEPDPPVAGLRSPPSKSSGRGSLRDGALKAPNKDK